MHKTIIIGPILFLVLLVGLSPLVLAQDEPYNPYGGGGVYGQILGFNFFDELIPIVWADVSAYDQDGELITRVPSMGGGYYAMFLPVGWYTLTVEEPGYKTFSREIFVSSGSSTAINVILELSKEPIHKPKEKPPTQYTYKISISGLPSDYQTQVYVDWVPWAYLSAGKTIELQFDIGTTHNISVDRMLERDGERYTEEKPSIIITSTGSHEFKYTVEYLLTFSTEPSDLSLPSKPQAGWYPEGTTISTPEAPELLEGAKGVRYRFKAWSLDDSEAPTNPYTFTMDRPHSLMVSYLIEYQLEVSSIYGVPTGAGWYSAGSTATISIEPSEGIFIRHIFEGWSGDYTGSDSTATFPVNRPMQIEAVWKTSYVIVSVLIILITISFAAGIIIFASQRLKKSPSTE